MRITKYGVVLFVAICILLLISCQANPENSNTPKESTPEITTPQESTPEITTPDVTTPEEKKVYVEEVKCDSITLLHEPPIVVEKYKNVREGECDMFFFEFIKAPEGTSYTTDPESLANNPNKVRINYELFPEGVSDPKVVFLYDETIANYVYFDEETETFVFLQRRKMLTVTIKSADGSNVKIDIKIMGI